METKEFVIIDEFDIAIEISDGVLLGYDVVNGEIHYHTEGIMREVCSELATLIKQQLNIANLEEYGVRTLNEHIEIPPANNSNYKSSLQEKQS